MKKLFTFFIAVLFSSLVYAQTPSTESINELFVLTKTEQTSNAMLVHIDQMMKQSIQMTSKENKFTPEQKEILDAKMEKLIEIVKEESSWEKTRPLITKIYQENFTQEEINGLIAFYKSPTGLAFTEKMPVVTEKIMIAVQAQMGPMMKKIQEVLRETSKAAKTNKTAK